MINPLATSQDLEIVGSLKQVNGKKNSKALSFDGKSYLKLKNSVDLRDKLFTICIWLKQDKNDDKKWADEMAIFSDSDKNKLYAGLTTQRDPRWGFGNLQKYIGAKPQKGKWVMFTYQLDGRFLPKQTGGQLQEDGTMSEVQEAKTTDMNLNLYENDRRSQGRRVADNSFSQGSLSTIGSFNGKNLFIGAMDDIKIYDRALKFNEIEALYDEGPDKFPSVRDGLTFWLNFDDQSFGEYAK